MKDVLKKMFSDFSAVITGLRATIPYMVGKGPEFKEITEEYPDKISARMPDDLPPRYRGLLYNDIEKCSGCGFCADICPVNCIRIETEPGPLKNLSWVAVFDIDHSKCIFCGLCVEICPTKSLVHTKEYQGSVFQGKDLVESFGRTWASEIMKEKWKEEQVLRDQSAEERVWFEKSPVGAEIRRKFEKNKGEQIE